MFVVTEINLQYLKFKRARDLRNLNKTEQILPNNQMSYMGGWVGNKYLEINKINKSTKLCEAG